MSYDSIYNLLFVNEKGRKLCIYI